MSTKVFPYIHRYKLFIWKHLTQSIQQQKNTSKLDANKTYMYLSNMWKFGILVPFDPLLNKIASKMYRLSERNFFTEYEYEMVIKNKWAINNLYLYIYGKTLLDISVSLVSFLYFWPQVSWEVLPSLDIRRRWRPHL
jgi:hypothetical protein